MDDDLVWLKQQLQNINHSPVSRSTLNNLEANISEAKVAIHRGNRCFSEKNTAFENICYFRSCSNISPSSKYFLSNVS